MKKCYWYEDRKFHLKSKTLKVTYKMVRNNYSGRKNYRGSQFLREIRIKINHTFSRLMNVYQAFSPSYDLAPPPRPFHLSGQVSCLSFCLSPVGRGGRGWGRSQIIRGQESPVLYKSFNTLWVGWLVQSIPITLATRSLWYSSNGLTTQNQVS